ncbi:MAG: sulfurtransferase [Anaerolineae bacterium]
MLDHNSPLVSTQWLAAHLTDPSVRVVDVRWYLPNIDRLGSAEYAAGHIPGAVFVDLETELAAEAYIDGPGRHPLPTPAAFQAVMRRLGISADTLVVAYDDNGGTAARLWWMLRYFGHESAAVLDGGIVAWTRERRRLETGAGPSVRPGTFEAHPNPSMALDKSQVIGLAGNSKVLLIDARPAERYEGRAEPIDARPGHIPGAKNLPWAQNLDADGHFLEPDALRKMYEDLGVNEADTVVCYCGSGVSACYDILAMYTAGWRDIQLYVGSWSDWSSSPRLPVATGRE